MKNSIYQGIKRRLSVVLAFILLIASVPFTSFAAHAAQAGGYGEAICGAGIKYTNMHWAPNAGNNFQAYTALGRQGLKTSSSATHLVLGLDDEFMYNLPNGTPVEITVEYFDEGNGHFSVHYDSYNPMLMRPDTVLDNDYLNETPVVHLQNSGEWKSHTFYIEDFKAANRINGGDLRVSKWWIKNNAVAKEEVLFGSVRVEYAELKDPFGTKISLGRTGNLMSADDDTALHIDSKNKVDEAVTVKVSGDVYDAYDKNVGKIEETVVEFAASEQREIKIPFANPKIHGLYKIKGSIEAKYKESGKTISKSFETKFSVSYIFDKETSVSDYGVMHHLALNFGKPEEAVEVLNYIGAGWSREDLNHKRGQMIDGRLVFNESCLNAWRTARDNGIKLIGILIWPWSETGMPVTEDDMKKWEIYVRDVVTQVKDIFDVYEIWNEPNISFGNKNNATPESYAETAKRAYPIIKEIDPDSIVLGLSTAVNGQWNIDYDWTKRVLEAKGYEGMDAFSVHPYEWSGVFRDKLWLESVEVLNGLMAEYGQQDKEIWITEFGFSTYIEGNGLGYTRREQYRNYALTRALNKAYDLYDVYGAYCLSDRGYDHELEERWGVVEWFFSDETPFAAKESFIAMTAFNHFINNDTETKKIIEADSVYAINFYDSKKAEDVLYLQSNNTLINENGGIEKAFNLGCSSVDVYDSFGNKINTIYSDNGKFSFNITGEPHYVVGSFTEFEETENISTIETKSTYISGSGGDVIELEFTKNTDKQLSLEFENMVEIVENDGFKGDKAKVKLRVPEAVGKTILFDVSAVDENGRSYYAEEYTLNVTQPLEIILETEQSAKLDKNHWRVRATIKNLCQSQSLVGKFKIEEPSNVADKNSVRSFSLEPQEEVVYFLSLPEKVNKSVMNILASATMDNGYRVENTVTTNFTAAKYTDKKPVIDGVIGNDEWRGSWIGANEFVDVRLIDDWGGADDLSFSGNLMWDKENFYMLAVVNDDVNYIYQIDDKVEMSWSADSLQVAFDDRLSVNSVEAGEFEEFGITGVPNGGAVVYRSNSYHDDHENGIVENCEVAIKRYDGYTVYEWCMPWDELFYKDYELDVEQLEKKYKFSIIANDRDTPGEKNNGRGWIEYMSGIGAAKQVDLFGGMTFEK